MIAIFGGFILQHRSAGRLQQASTAEAARPSAEIFRSTVHMIPSGAAMVLLSGLAMAWGVFPVTTPWLATAFGGLVLIGALGGGSAGRWAASLAQTIGSEVSGVLTTEQGRVISASGPRIMRWAGNGSALGVLWLMATKPDWLPSVTVVLLATGAGALIGARMASTNEPGLQ